VFCDLEELSPLATATALIPIETTIIGPSLLSAVMLDFRDICSGYEVYSMIYYNKLLT
jgi:hypothetical protein